MTMQPVEFYPLRDDHIWTAPMIEIPAGIKNSDMATAWVYNWEGMNI